MSRKCGVVQTLVSALVFFLVYALFGWYGFAETKTEVSKKLEQDIEYVEVKSIPLYEAFKIRQKWHVTAYQPKELKEFGPNKPAILCFWFDPAKKREFCFVSEDEYSEKNKRYSYSLVKDLKIITLQKSKKPKEGILFIAENRDFAIGWLTFISIWSYNEKDRKFEKILPTKSVTEQGEYKIVPAIKDKIEGVFVTADFILKLEEGETHYSPHRYALQIYQIGEDGKYRFVGKYETKTKYLSLDDVDSSEINVIEPEIRNIQKFFEK